MTNSIYESNCNIDKKRPAFTGQEEEGIAVELEVCKQ